MILIPQGFKVSLILASLSAILFPLFPVCAATLVYLMLSCFLCVVSRMAWIMCEFAFLFHLCRQVVRFERIEMTLALLVRISHSELDGIMSVAISTAISSALVEDGNL